MQLATDNLSTLNDTVALAELTVNRWLRHESDTADIDVDRLNTAVHALWRLTAIRKTIPQLIPYEQLTPDPIDVSSITDSVALAESLYNGWMRRQSTADPADIDIDCINAAIHALHRLGAIRKTLPEIKSMNNCRIFKEIGDRAKLAREVSDRARDIEREANENFDTAHSNDFDDDNDNDYELTDWPYDDDDVGQPPSAVDSSHSATSDQQLAISNKHFLNPQSAIRNPQLRVCPTFRSPLAQTLHNTIGMIAKLPDPLIPSSQPETGNSKPDPQNPQLATRNSQLATSSPHSAFHTPQSAIRNRHSPP